MDLFSHLDYPIVWNLNSTLNRGKSTMSPYFLCPLRPFLLLTKGYEGVPVL